MRKVLVQSKQYGCWKADADPNGDWTFDADKAHRFDTEAQAQASLRSYERDVIRLVPA